MLGRCMGERPDKGRGWPMLAPDEGLWHCRIAGVQPSPRMLMLTCTLFAAIDVIVGAIKASKDTKKESLRDAKLHWLQFRATAVSSTGAPAAKATTSELEASEDATLH